VARLVEQTMRRRHADAGTQHTPAHLAGAEQAVTPKGKPKPPGLMRRPSVWAELCRRLGDEVDQAAW
jgi:hypothetical protein